MEQKKDIIFKRNTKDKTIRNIAYVHTYCKESVIEYIDIGDEYINAVNLKEIILEIENRKAQKSKKESKFINLTAYFHNVKKVNVSLSFKDMEKILGFKLCNSAYKYRSYFTNNKDGMIGETWTKQGYKIKKIDMKNEKIEFERFDFRRTKVIIPKFLYRLDLPQELIEETNKFFARLKERYR